MHNGNNFYACASSSGQEITDAKILKYINDKELCSWTSFREFKECCLGIWELKTDPFDPDWTKLKCSCPSYLKKYLCKHVLGLAMKLRLVDTPEHARGQPLARKLKRGRKLKARRAYLIMPIVDDPVAGDENSDSEATSTQVAVPEPIQTTQIAASSRLMIVRSASAVEGTTGVSNRRARGGRGSRGPYRPRRARG